MNKWTVIKGTGTAICLILITACTPKAFQTFQGPRPASLAAVSTHPMIEHLKVDSFRDAVVQYPAGSGGYHKIIVTDYLITKTLDILPSDTNAASMKNLEAVCDYGSVILPNAICTATLVIQVDDTEYRSHIENMDVGDAYIVQGYGIDSAKHKALIIKQIKVLLDKLIAGTASKLNS